MIVIATEEIDSKSFNIVSTLPSSISNYLSEPRMFHKWFIGTLRFLMFAWNSFHSKFCSQMLIIIILQFEISQVIFYWPEIIFIQCLLKTDAVWNSCRNTKCCTWSKLITCMSPLLTYVQVQAEKSFASSSPITHNASTSLYTSQHNGFYSLLVVCIWTICLLLGLY